MNVILLERVGKMGDLGDEISVRNGFARNFLIPKGKAVRANAENRRVFEGRRAELEKIALEKHDVAQARANTLESVAIVIAAKASDEGKLFGSVGTQEIADALVAQGKDVHKTEVRMPDGVFGNVGEYEVSIQLHSELSATIMVAVVAED
ncbi:MAG: 50S ribosomal protein L9 [Pseudomonadales bacterium]|nr:50S ribosomal protein L9 [Pseudomonadales bacterium]